MQQRFSLCVALVALVLSGFMAGGARAKDVSSPSVDEGELEIEFKNRFDRDSRPSEDGYREHEIGIEYGLTDWLGLEFGGEWEKHARTHDYDFVATELKAAFEFAERGEYFIDTGAKLGYKRAHSQGDADAITAELLLAKTISRVTLMSNIELDYQVGSHADANPELCFAALARYNLHKAFNPALEYYADMGPLSDMGGYGQQKHHLGPAFTGKIAPGLKYEAGWIMGVSDRAEDHIIKINFKYSFPI
jgi:hypothetical protein